MAADHAHAPEQPGRAWLRVAVWVSLSLLALWVLLRGQSDLYVAANVRWTLWLAALACLALAALDGLAAFGRGEYPPGWRALRAHRDPRAFSVGLLFFPFVCGVAIPPGVLGANSILANSGVVTLLPAPALAATPVSSSAPLDLNLLQLQDRLRAGAVPSGAIAQVTGFVFHQPGLPGHTWLLTRFITPHCVAEAQPIALVVDLTNGPAPPDNTWVTVSGPLTAGTLNGHAVARLAVARITRIATPPDPYLIY